MANLGRPVSPVPQQIADELIAWLSEGKTLRAFCRQPGKPNNTTIYGWIHKDEIFCRRVARARVLGYDEIAEECLEIADNALPDEANLTKVRVWARLELLKKWDPKRYGERITHSGDDAQPLVVRHIGKP